MKYYHAFLSLCVTILFCLSFQVNAQVLEGRVTNASNQALSHTTIRIVALHKVSASNDKGEYRMENLPLGLYSVEFRHVGYRAVTREVTVNGTTSQLNIAMEESAIEAASITVTAEPQPTDVMESPLSTLVLQGDELNRLRGQSLGESLSQLPGVNGFGSGALSTKPVLRGLMGQRVLIAQNGSRMESQSWDEPQSPEIDAMDMDRVEIVRGPNSVMFGSDAVGGVVNIIRKDVFSLAASPLSANLMLDGNSNNGSGAAALSLFGTSGNVAYRINATGRLAGDYSAPAGSVKTWRADTVGGLHYLLTNRDLAAQSVFNSGTEEFSGAATLGWRQSWGTMTFDYTHFGRKLFIHPEPGRKEVELNINTMKMDTLDASPIQEVMHERAVLSANLPMDYIRLEFIGGFQYDKRREEGVHESEEDEKKKEALGIPPEVQLDLYTVSFDARAHVSNLTLGLSYSNQRNQSLGIKALVPEYHASNLGAYIYGEKKFDKSLRLSLSMRYDAKSMDVDERRTKDSLRTLLNPADTLSYGVIIAQLGLAWTVNPNLVLSANVGPGWRAPVAAELYSFGRDEGDIQYKVGNNALTTERSQNVDVSVRYADASLQAEATVYHNRIQDYIYVQPTGRITEGVYEYRYTQADATLIGFEARVQAQLSSSFLLNLGADMVRGELDSTASPLSRMPATRVLSGLTYLQPSLLGIRNFRCDLNPRYSFAQNRVDSLEIPTAAYFLLGLSIGGDISIADHTIHCSLSADNLTNTVYVDHLSRYKQLALNPGLNVGLKIRVPFEIISAPSKP